mmetsp:Transcript_16534/g.20064  ORF Transcript_16534/g.20064 Transcript_16534/m.20064 type:complete len:241 (-) Transcript_16534:134-856(-)
MDNNPVLVIGATGRIGRQVVQQLLGHGYPVRAIVRDAEKLKSLVGKHDNLSVCQGSVLDLSEEVFTEEVEGSRAVVSCLGHVISFQGMYGQPRYLCRDTVKKTFETIEKLGAPSKFILVNTVGVLNPAGDSKRGFLSRLAVSIIEFLIPPARDNKAAAWYLSKDVGTDSAMKWVSVRPCGLLEEEMSDYDVHECSFPGALFNATVSIPNVAHFMCELITNEQKWKEWEGKMPIIVNKDGY